MIRRRGIGDAATVFQSTVTPGTTPDLGYPGWCDWMPFADTFDSCKPKTSAQLRDSQIADLRQIAAVNPELAASAVQWADQLEQQQRAAGLTNEWDAAVNCPKLSDVFGPAMAASFPGCSGGQVGGVPDPNKGMSYLFPILIGVGVLLLVTR